MKLQTRIQLFTTVVLIVLLLIASTCIYFYFKNTAIASEQNRLVNTANNITKEINKKSDVSMEDMLQAYLIHDGLIRIVDGKNHAFVQVYRDHVYRDIVSNYHNGQFEHVFPYQGSMFAMVSIPVIHENGEVVNLQVIENIDHLHENIQNLKWVLVITTIIVSIILFVTSGFVGRLILLPIQRLTNTMNTIENQGSFEQIAVASESKDELNEMAMTFNRMMTKLEESYLKQEQFVSDASHELKTPLTVIDSYVKLLKRWGKERPEVLDEAINSIESESRRMKYLTEQFLLLARSEEMNTPDKEVVDIAAIIKKTVHVLQPSFKHTIHFNNFSDPIYLFLHEQSFIQLLVILLDNAKKYSDADITVDLNESNGFVRISVKDQGVGIPPEALEHLFDRMYRVDKARSRKTGGSGLGLSIAKRIVQLHEGEITVESVEGKGSTFTVSFPRLEV